MSAAGSSGNFIADVEEAALSGSNNSDLEEAALSGSDISVPANYILTLSLDRPLYDSLDAHPVKIEEGLLKVPTSPHLNKAHSIKLISLVTLGGTKKYDLDFHKYIFIDWRQNKDLKNLKNTFRKGKNKVKLWKIRENDLKCSQ